jgi:hypothetical protein
MGVTWDDVGEALRTLGSYVRDVGLWFTVADTVTVTDDHVARLRELVEATFAEDQPDTAAARAQAGGIG